jgi:hypothetical protein
LNNIENQGAYLEVRLLKRPHPDPRSGTGQAPPGERERGRQRSLLGMTLNCGLQ